MTFKVSKEMKQVSKKPIEPKETIKSLKKTILDRETEVEVLLQEVITRDKRIHSDLGVIDELKNSVSTLNTEKNKHKDTNKLNIQYQGQIEEQEKELIVQGNQIDKLERGLRQKDEELTEKSIQLARALGYIDRILDLEQLAESRKQDPQITPSYAYTLGGPKVDKESRY